MVEPQSKHLSEARVARRFIPLGLKFYKLSRRRQSSVRERSARQRREAEEIRRPDLKKLFTLLDLCVSSLRRGHANLLCIVPILTDDPRRESEIT